MNSTSLSGRERVCVGISVLLLLGWTVHAISIYIGSRPVPKDYGPQILMAIQQYNSDNSAHNQMKFDVGFYPEHIAWLRKRKAQLTEKLKDLELGGQHYECH